MFISQHDNILFKLNLLLCSLLHMYLFYNGNNGIEKKSTSLSTVIIKIHIYMLNQPKLLSPEQ